MFFNHREKSAGTATTWPFLAISIQGVVCTEISKMRLFLVFFSKQSAVLLAKLQFWHLNLFVNPTIWFPIRLIMACANDWLLRPACFKYCFSRCCLVINYL